MTLATAQTREHCRHDITSHAFWSQPFAVRDRMFSQLRAGDGLTWHAPLPSLFPMEEPGFWALTRRADIAYVSQHPELFTSTNGVALDPMPAEVQRFASFFLTMDPPMLTIMLLSGTGVELAKFRRANPGDDLMTSIVNADVDGHRLPTRRSAPS